MVRINILEPWRLADQHLIAEYNEILMLIGHARKHGMPKKIPAAYILGPGHISFFKNKLQYIKKRHEAIKKEMRKRGFVPTKSIELKEFSREMLNDWAASKDDVEAIKERLTWKIGKKPNYYRYYGAYKPSVFLIGLLTVKKMSRSPLGRTRASDIKVGRKSVK